MNNDFKTVLFVILNIVISLSLVMMFSKYLILNCGGITARDGAIQEIYICKLDGLKIGLTSVTLILFWIVTTKLFRIKVIKK